MFALQGTTIGGTFVNKTYDNTTLVSSKYITLFADLRCPPEEAEVSPSLPLSLHPPSFSLAIELMRSAAHT